MNDDHLPAPGQTCENCSQSGHLMCWDGDESPGQFELFTQVHDVLKPYMWERQSNPIED